MIHKSKLRFFSLILAVVMCVTVFGILPASAASVSSFTDLKSGAWYYDSVSYVISKGLYQGLTETKFGPSNTMTRGMFVTVLGRLAGANPDAWCAGKVTGSGVNIRSGAGTNYNVIGTAGYGNSVTIKGKTGNWYYVQCGSKNGYISADYVKPSYHCFKDVPYGQYYTGYAIWAYEKGYVSGTSDSGTFSANAQITREQICKILYSYAEGNGLSLTATEEELSFSDASSIHSWATDAVRVLQRAGVIGGYDDNTIKPGKNASRAEVAKMLYSFISVTGASTGSGSSGTTTDTSTTGTTSDAVTVSGETVGVYSCIRVGIYASSRVDLNSQVSSVKLELTNGSGFEYGYMDDVRSFNTEGTLSSTTIVVTTDGYTFTVKDGGGNVLVRRDNSIAFHPISSGKALTRINGDYCYYGDFNCLNAYGDSGKITFVNHLNLDDYVKGVLPFEFGANWPLETLKAGAIAIRSYAMSYIGSSVYKEFGFDVDNSTRTQVYYGRRNYSDSYFSQSDAAVDATANMYLTYNGNVCYCMYSASNGGYTKASSSSPYMIAREDPYDKEAGKGSNGHGYGLSQWGSYIMGKNYGMNYLDILGFYYPGTSIRFGV